MSKWTFERTANQGGRFQILISKVGHTPVDVTYLRGVPTQLTSFSSADPFGDSTAVIDFPQITPFDDFDSSDIGSWLGDYSNVDIWWIPYLETLPPGTDTLPEQYQADIAPYLDPVTNQYTIYAPTWNYTKVGGNWTAASHRGYKVFEGFIASMDLTAGSSQNVMEIQCQGALFQADRYLEKPFYPPNPQTLESLIQGSFSHKQRPHLRTKPVIIDWPEGWAKVAPAYTGNSANIYSPNVKPGDKWSGYTSRSTGSWDHSLTSFVQDNLSAMLTQDDCGVTPGNQWTLLMRHQGESGANGGRQPVLQIRDRFRAPDFSMWAGTPGLELDLTRDTTQMANAVYGDGTGVDGTAWRNAVINDNGTRTDYLPLAASPTVFPLEDNKRLDIHAFVSESYVKYGTGFDQPNAVTSAEKTLQRDLDPGWAGTITLTTDPSPDLSRFQIQAGMTVNLKGLFGTGTSGMNFHIASVEHDCTDSGTSQLTVDTRYRDLLNLEEAIARNRDPLTPAKLLQVNRASAMVEDVEAPWDYKAGSGFVPKASKELDAYMPRSIIFPYQSFTRSHTPFDDPHWYVKVDADSDDSKKRWSHAVPILMAEKGTISRSEFAVYDKDGNVVKIPFHVSIYYNWVNVENMPQSNGVYSPFIHGAFESINPATGEDWGPDNFLAPDPSMIIGWGNYQQKAGYSPGRQADGMGPTGQLVDESTWTWDITSSNNKDWKHGQPAGKKQSRSAITVYAMFYAEYTEPVFFRGRLYKQNQGPDS